MAKKLSYWDMTRREREEIDKMDEQLMVWRLIMIFVILILAGLAFAAIS